MLLQDVLPLPYERPAGVPKGSDPRRQLDFVPSAPELLYPPQFVHYRNYGRQHLKPLLLKPLLLKLLLP